MEMFSQSLNRAVANGMRIPPRGNPLFIEPFRIYVISKIFDGVLVEGIGYRPIFPFKQGASEV